MSYDKIKIGSDLTVTRLGLGTNRIQRDDKSKEALKRAIELEINFIDTASAYTGGISEEVIGETLSPYKDIVVATKGGISHPDFHVDGRPETLAKSVENSLKKLKLQTIPLYFLHRIDPKVPLKESLLFLKQIQNEGKIKYFGLSQVSIDEIEEARKYIDVAAVENEYNLSERKYDDVLSYAEKENIVFIPFFPLHFDSSRFSNLEKLQEKYQATASQIAIAWLLKRSPKMLPIPGSLSPIHMEENIAAMKIELSDEDFNKLSRSAA